jgi:hypothetical protein
MYPILVTISLLLVAGSSVYMSVYGVMSVFASNAPIIMCMGLGMEIGKLLTVAHLYRNWQKIGGLTKSLYVLIVSVLVILTSMEVIGFLSLSHASATQNLKTTETALKGIKKEAAILQKQILTIDATLAGLPTSHVTRRIKERKVSGYSQKHSRLLEIAKQQSELETGFFRDQASSSPIFAVAKIMKINETDAIAMLILILVLVLEPLSIGLTVATSAAWMTHKTTSKEEPQRATSNKELITFQKQYSLSIGQLARITGRKKPKTCEAWLNGTTPVPAKALQAVQAWANKQSHELTSIKNTTERDKEGGMNSNGIQAQ